jgi:lia operon protein LiaG
MMKKAITLGMALILSLFTFAGCSNSKSSEMANELRFSLDEISSLTISYDEEKITFFESNDDDLLIKEYMTENKSSYYAKVTEDKESIHISEGGKPFFKDGFTRYIEVYLPESYQENLTVTSTNGDIDFSGMNLDLSTLRVDNSSGNVTLDNAAATDIHLSSTSGTLDLGNIEADQIRLETTSGSVICTGLNGNVTYTSTSGNADIKSAIGSGSYKANNSGSLNVVYTKVNGDLSFFNKNDSITLTLPENLEFEFQGTTKNGSISTTFQKDVTVNGRTTSGVVGDNPTVTVKVETKNGDIKVTQ